MENFSYLKVIEGISNDNWWQIDDKNTISKNSLLSMKGMVLRFYTYEKLIIKMNTTKKNKGKEKKRKFRIIK